MKYTKKHITEALAYWRKQLKKLDEAIGPKPVDLFIQKTRQALSFAKDPDNVTVLTAYRKWAATSVKFDKNEKRLAVTVTPAKNNAEGLTLSKFIEQAKKTGMTKMSDASSIVALVSTPDVSEYEAELVDVLTDKVGKVFLDFGLTTSPEELASLQKHKSAKDFMSEADKKDAEAFLA